MLLCRASHRFHVFLGRHCRRFYSRLRCASLRGRVCAICHGIRVIDVPLRAILLLLGSGSVRAPISILQHRLRLRLRLCLRLRLYLLLRAGFYIRVGFHRLRLRRRFDIRLRVRCPSFGRRGVLCLGRRRRLPGCGRRLEFLWHVPARRARLLMVVERIALGREMLCPPTKGRRLRSGSSLLGDRCTTLGGNGCLLSLGGGAAQDGTVWQSP